MGNTQYTTVGVIGSAKASEELVTAELDNFLPQHLDTIFVPDKIRRGQQGLQNVLGWLTKEFGEDGFDTAAPDDIIEELKTANAEKEQAVLVVLWGEDGDPETHKLVEKALDAGIRVVDLTAGMDDMKLEPDDAPEPAQDEAESKPPRRTRRSRGKDTPEPAEAASEPSRGKRQPRSKAEQSTIEEQIAAAASDDPPFEPDVPVTTATEAALTLTDEELAAFVDTRIQLALGDIFLGLFKQVTGKLKEANDAELPADEEDLEQTFTLIETPDGEFRKKGRGRPRAGSKEVTFTLAEIQEQGLEELIK